MLYLFRVGLLVTGMPPFLSIGNTDLVAGLDIFDGLIHEDVLLFIEEVMGIILERVIVDAAETKNHGIKAGLLFSSFRWVGYFIDVIIELSTVAVITFVFNPVALFEHGISRDKAI